MNVKNDEMEINSIDDLQKIDINEIDSSDDLDYAEPDYNEDVEVDDADVPSEDHAGADGYKPNFNYKVKDEDFEFDDRVKSIIKSKEDEDYFRDIYTKASGLETYKHKISNYESKISELSSGVEELSGGFHRIKELRDSKNMEELFYTLGVKEDDIVSYALEIAKKQILPKEERQAIDSVKNYERENKELKTRLDRVESEYKNNAYQTSVQQDFQRLQSLISQENDLAEVMKQKGLDLQSEVISCGMSEFGRKGEDISIDDAFQIVVKKYSWLKDVARNDTPKIGSRDSLPVIKGGSSVPMSEEITSIEQLQQLYDKKFSN